jgi:hypothetical protein
MCESECLVWRPSSTILPRRYLAHIEIAPMAFRDRSYRHLDDPAKDIRVLTIEAVKQSRHEPIRATLPQLRKNETFNVLLYCWNPRTRMLKSVPLLTAMYILDKDQAYVFEISSVLAAALLVLHRKGVALILKYL